MSLLSFYHINSTELNKEKSRVDIYIAYKCRYIFAKMSSIFLCIYSWYIRLCWRVEKLFENVYITVSTYAHK